MNSLTQDENKLMANRETLLYNELQSLTGSLFSKDLNRADRMALLDKIEKLIQEFKKK